MTNESEIAIVEHVSGTALENFRDRDEVRELAQRLLSLHPQAKEIGISGMTAVAQLALLVGASPLPGTNEIHVWKSGDKIQFQLGYLHVTQCAANYIEFNANPKSNDPQAPLRKSR